MVSQEPDLEQAHRAGTVTEARAKRIDLLRRFHPPSAEANWRRNKRRGSRSPARLGRPGNLRAAFDQVPELDLEQRAGGGSTGGMPGRAVNRSAISPADFCKRLAPARPVRTDVAAAG